MTDVYDDPLGQSDKMPLAKVGELRMWNLKMPGLDLEDANESDWVFIGWNAAYRYAVQFLEQLEMSEEVIQKILALLEEDDIHVAPETVPVKTRHRLYDVHRMRIALLILYPQQPEHQRIWLTAKHQDLRGRTPIEIMISEGTDRMRRLLEGRLNR